MPTNFRPPVCPRRRPLAFLLPGAFLLALILPAAKPAKARDGSVSKVLQGPENLPSPGIDRCGERGHNGINQSVRVY